MSFLDKTQESSEEESDLSLLQLCCNRSESTHFSSTPKQYVLYKYILVTVRLGYMHSGQGRQEHWFLKEEIPGEKSVIYVFTFFFFF